MMTMAFPLETWINSNPIAYETSRTISLTVEKKLFKISPVKEEYMPADTIEQHLSKDNIPVFYSKNIRTSVCFDNQCRLLVATVYWNPTGRYLGYSLPNGEFLSKKDHDPFIAAEYKRLHSLLSDPNLPLGTISYNELVVNSKPSLAGVDGVSGATNKDLLKYTVEGAAYTTYKLYTIIYGEDQELVRSWSRNQFSESFLKLGLSSIDLTDRLWFLNELKGKFSKYPGIKDVVIELVSSEDFSISEKAIQVFSPKDLRSMEIQERLLLNYPRMDLGRKNRILDLLYETEKLSPKVIKNFSAGLLSMEMVQQIRILELFSNHHINDPLVIKKVAELSKSTNAYLAQKAMAYLKDFEN